MSLQLMTIDNSIPPMTPDQFIETSLIRGGFKMNAFQFAVGVSVKGDRLRKGSDFPPTPKESEKWRMGFVQNIVSHRIDVVWADGDDEKRSTYVGTKELDVSDESIKLNATPFAHPDSFCDIYYGGDDDPPFWDEFGDSQAPMTLTHSDAPSMFIRPFKNGAFLYDQANPILEITRRLSLRFWLVAVPLSQVSNLSKYHVLGQCKKDLSLFCHFSRRAEPQTPTWLDRFEIGKDVKMGTLDFRSHNGGSVSNMPVITGASSAKRVRKWMTSNGFA